MKISKKFLYFVTWAILIIVGGMMITNGGITPIVTNTLGTIAIVLGVVGLGLEIWDSAKAGPIK